MPADARWCHVTISTYGNWLPGDPRGFRTWNHREHVEGDYKNPPRQDYRFRHESSRRRRRSPPAVLSTDERRIAAMAILESLNRSDILVICISMSGCHGHILGRFPPGDVRLPIGDAKKHAWFRLRELGWTRRLWAKRCGVHPVNDRPHQLNIYRYIFRHEGEGAFVWAWHRDRG